MRIWTTMLLLVCFSSLQAQKGKQPPPMEVPEPSVTEHSITIEGKRIDYTATAGYIVLEGEDGEQNAKVFYMAYTKKGSEAKERPVTFSFNGGPGSSSVWLHLGVLGPKRVKMGPDGEPLPPPYELVENEYSWLEETDLIFIDPVTTGYSRAAERKKEKMFHSYRGDIRSVGKFIRLYLTKEKRWGSPKYLIGESYGTTRAAGLTEHLLSSYGLTLNGVILVSAVTNFQTLVAAPGNDLPYSLFLPSFTAAAHYHEKLAPEQQDMELEALLEEVRDFAETTYTVALMRGNSLPEETFNEVAASLAKYTGLSEAFIKRANLRISTSDFTKALFREENEVIGRFDARYKGPDTRSANASRGGYDPSYQPAAQGAFSTLIYDYIGRELDFETDLAYNVLTGRVRPWKYEPAQNRYLNVAESLGEAMVLNPDMKVWIANGYYDLATPFFATEYTMDHLALPKQQLEKVQMTYYPAGHMMYLQKKSLQQMKEEARAFYRD